MDELSATRRRLLALAGAGAAALWLPPRAWAQARLRHDPFRLGVASGSPAADSVVLWTRLMPAEGEDALDLPQVAVRWQVAHDEAFTRIARQGQALADPALGHAVHVECDGLEPDRAYHYRFLAGDGVSSFSVQ
ncbi:PhoD-like phosphatase N-terminal domain-containing protein [Methylibium sp.]|uniref:PhoD-like phosphatase N-terminal domain-containing protein n=1 Tax=Methylibium sp. TaxID=2067992 RepID=UPI00333F3F46